MSRSQRIHGEVGVHHAFLRGINRQNIFEDDADRRRFLDCAVAAADLSGVRVLAYCLMSNHVHLVVEVTREPVGQFFRRLGARYVWWFNHKYDRVGHLWQDRFKSRPVVETEDLINVIRYVHGNPVEAGLCATPAEYEWSSAAGPDRVVDARRVKELTGVADWAELRGEVDEAAARPPSAVQGRRPSDEQAWSVLAAVSGAGQATAFQALGRPLQQAALAEAFQRGASVRQLARLTGLNRGVVWRSVTPESADSAPA
ncbi:MAG: transposase [Propionibacteriaceae bacterium]|jgi:REP element-mobilizing transposase RayT|nr:transposase [Propionibacteriaceae bacterium]